MIINRLCHLVYIVLGLVTSRAEGRFCKEFRQRLGAAPGARAQHGEFGARQGTGAGDPGLIGAGLAGLSLVARWSRRNK